MKPTLTREGRKNIIEFLRSFDVMMQTDWCERTLGKYQKMRAAADELERPFGFTPEDVSIIKKVLSSGLCWEIDPKDGCERLRDLSSRIEALLPPEPLARVTEDSLLAYARFIKTEHDRMKISLFEAAALRRAVEAYDSYLSQQLKISEDRRDSFASAATRFRRTLQAELDTLAHGEASDDA
jgi:hypothetical protein